MTPSTARSLAFTVLQFTARLAQHKAAVYTKEGFVLKKQEKEKWVRILVIILVIAMIPAGVLIAVGQFAKNKAWQDNQVKQQKVQNDREKQPKLIVQESSDGIIHLQLPAFSETNGFGTCENATYYLYDVDFENEKITYITESYADKDGNISFGDFLYGEESVNTVFWYAVTQVSAADDGIQYDQSVLGYSVDVYREHDTLTAEVNYYDFSNVLVPCKICEGIGVKEIDSIPLHLKYITDLETYAGFGFAEVSDLKLDTVEEAAAAVLTKDNSHETISLVYDDDGHVVFDPDYEFRENFGVEESNKIGENVQIVMLDKNGTAYKSVITMPTAIELLDETRFSKNGKDVYVLLNNIPLKVGIACTACDENGITFAKKGAIVHLEDIPTFHNVYIIVHYDVEAVLKPNIFSTQTEN